MALETVVQVRDALADAGFTEQLVAAGSDLRVVSSGERHAPADLVVAKRIRFAGVSDDEQEAVLFALADPNGRPVGSYAPVCRPAMAAVDAAIVEQLHEQPIAEEEIEAHARHDHIAAVFDDREAARAAVDELRSMGLGSDRMGVALREGAAQVYERDAEQEMIRDTGRGMAIGAAIGLLAGMSVAAIVLVPGGFVMVGGLLAIGVPLAAGGAMLGGFAGEALAERAFTEREDLSAVQLGAGQQLVAVCGHGHRETVEALLERHGGELLMRPGLG